MRRFRILRCLTGLLVSASLLMAPWAGHAGVEDRGQEDGLAVLSLTCLEGASDQNAGDDPGQVAAACYACPAGCIAGCAVACNAHCFC